MATQIASLPSRLTITEDTLAQLQHLAERQNVSLSEALEQAIQISDIVVSQGTDPNTKILFKRGDKYKELTVGWRRDEGREDTAPSLRRSASGSKARLHGSDPVPASGTLR